ncbi:MFS general substrate transporter [Hyaloscypha hepaticicola]|uniref:MFS general substrate transporter n=1 Tax=Hyaloscypha hepaticicola TaxID=2082293 RepID=A0A2J6QEY6_9HELO|nr:MFS general substrate transporter [Hyaloscypha hepaticicola]
MSQVTKEHSKNKLQETVMVPDTVGENSHLNPWSKQPFTLYFILIFAFLNATSSGFDGSLMGSINAEPQYKNFFHIKETGSSTGLVFILYNAASMIGCAFGGPIMDYFGRRRGMQPGCLFTLGGAVLASAAQTLPQFKASRFLLGFGRLGGYYKTFYFVGSITATGVVYATSQYVTTLAWRLPLALQVIPLFIVFIGCFFIPESPRWLASRDRMDEAAKIIYKYHGGEDNEVAKLEIREIALHVKLSKSQTPGEYIRGLWDYRELFNSHSARWRTGMVTLITFASALTGNSILTFFQPTMLAAVGVTSTRRKLLLTFASSISSAPQQMIISSEELDSSGAPSPFSLATALSLLAAMSSQVAASTASGHTPSKAISGVGIFSIFLFGWIFSFVYTHNQSLYCNESNLATILFTYTTSIALGDISWKYYFFFFGVETVGRTIEELDACFEANFLPKASWKRTKIVRDENEDIGVKVADIGA